MNRQIPIFHDIKELSCTEDGRHILVNFKDEVSTIHGTVVAVY